MSHRGALPGMTVSVTVGVCVLLVKLSAVPMLRGAMPNAEERGVRIRCWRGGLYNRRSQYRRSRD